VALDPYLHFVLLPASRSMLLPTSRLPEKRRRPVLPSLQIKKGTLDSLLLRAMRHTSSAFNSGDRCEAPITWFVLLSARPSKAGLGFLPRSSSVTTCR
jgi:hypothetical protein